MASLGPMEWILILLVLVLLFGAKKLPDTAKALGQSLRMFKKETSKLSEEESDGVVQAKAEPVAASQLPPTTPSVEERLRALEEENRRLKETQAANAEAPVNAQAQHERNSG